MRVVIKTLEPLTSTEIALSVKVTWMWSWKRGLHSVSLSRINKGRTNTQSQREIDTEKWGRKRKGLGGGAIETKTESDREVGCIKRDRGWKRDKGGTEKVIETDWWLDLCLLRVHYSLRFSHWAVSTHIRLYNTCSSKATNLSGKNCVAL